MEEGLVSWLASVHPVMPEIIMWVGVVLGLAVMVIIATPWKGDDKALEEVKKFPIIGGVLAGIMKMSPAAALLGLFKSKE